MSDNKKLKNAIRARQAKTGERYSTARMHILAGLPAPETAAPMTGYEGPPRFDYLCHGPDGLPTGEGVLTRVRLRGPVMACDGCGFFLPLSMVRAGRCDTPNCTGKVYEWLHHERVVFVDPASFSLEPVMTSER